MQSTNTPAKVLTPLAEQDSSRAELPNTTSDPGRASQTQGFPPLTGQPPEAGGVPPQLPDMNGALNMASRLGWWGQLGGRYTFDGSFANNSAINGYPRGALLMSADFTGEWLSTAEANTANPDTTGTGWVPGYHYGATTLASQAGGTVVLTPAQAAKTTLFVNGTLTSNLIVEVPAWIREWTVYNGTSGAFTVSVRTPGRPAVVVPQTNVPSVVRGNGTDVAVATFDVPQATTSVSGRTRYATAGEAATGTNETSAVTPAGVAQAIAIRVPQATNSVAGRIRIGTAQEQAAYTAVDLAVTPAGLGTAVAALQASINTKFNSSGGSITGDTTIRKVTPRLQLLSAEANRGYRVNANVGNASDAGFTIEQFNGGDWAAVWSYSGGRAGSTAFPGAVSAAGGFDTPSSREIKNDLGPFPYGLDDVLSLKPIRYAYKNDESQRGRLGFYLEDVREVAPEVAGDTALQEQQIIPMLVSAVHELLARIENLEGR